MVDYQYCSGNGDEDGPEDVPGLAGEDVLQLPGKLSFSWPSRKKKKKKTTFNDDELLRH